MSRFAYRRPNTDDRLRRSHVSPLFSGMSLPILLGAHTSIAGGTHEAPPRAKAIGATAMQIFTKMANRWADRECEGEECTRFAEALAGCEVERGALTAHDSYLINLASPDPVLRARSLDSMVAELRRCASLGIPMVVSHPGNYMDDRASGLARNADAITEALERAPGPVMILLETTAGQGTVLGATFEELAAIIERVPEPFRSRLGICLDTAHVWAAGFDLVNAYDDMMARLSEVIGLDRLLMLHLNDSKVPLGSRKDRHELIGEGHIGELPFRRIMNDERLARVPKVIETPKLDDHEATDRRMLERLRGYVASPDPAP
jgi:deoxyribonuclease-4